MAIGLSATLYVPVAAAELADVHKLYEGGRFDEAITILTDEVKQLPTDVSVHYYLALCYTKKNELGLADEQYRYALAHTTDRVVANYCLQAIAALEKEKRRGEVILPGAEPAQHAAVEADERATEEKLAIMNEAKARCATIDKDTALECQRIRSKGYADFDLIAFTDDNGNQVGGRAKGFGRSRVEAWIVSRQSEAMKAAEEKKQEIIDAAKQRIAGLDDSTQRVRDEMYNPGTTTQLLPQSKTFIVRNYVHLGDEEQPEPPEPMTASPGKYKIEKK
ncbi:MAG TPA: hypothetical protein V6D22_03005 [Candidatus Obscuribacterales bacterium]